MTSSPAFQRKCDDKCPSLQHQDHYVYHQHVYTSDNSQHEIDEQNRKKDQ